MLPRRRVIDAPAALRRIVRACVVRRRGVGVAAPRVGVAVAGAPGRRHGQCGQRGGATALSARWSERAGSGGSAGASGDRGEPDRDTGDDVEDLVVRGDDHGGPGDDGVEVASAARAAPRQQRRPTHAVHTAQARCSDGIAAYWLSAIVTS